MRFKFPTPNAWESNFPTPWKTLIIKFPPPRDGKDVKCPGYARGGGACWSFDLTDTLEKQSIIIIETHRPPIPRHCPIQKMVDEFLLHLWSLGTRTDSDADETKRRAGIQVGKTENNIGYQIRKTAYIFPAYSAISPTLWLASEQTRKSWCSRTKKNTHG